MTHRFDTSQPNQTDSLAKMESRVRSIRSSTGWLLYTHRLPPTWPEQCRED